MCAIFPHLGISRHFFFVSGPASKLVSSVVFFLTALFSLVQAGWELISIDGESLEGASHAQAVDIIRRAYNDKSQNVMNIVCVKN